MAGQIKKEGNHMALMAITPHISDLENFLSQSHRRKYPNKTIIIHEGDKCETLFYIISGSVSVVLEDDDGKEAVITYLNTGDFFGEMGLFEQLENRSAKRRRATDAAIPQQHGKECDGRRDDYRCDGHSARQPRRGFRYRVQRRGLHPAGHPDSRKRFIGDRARRKSTRGKFQSATTIL